MPRPGRFRYGLDPLCLAACTLYAANRWILRPAFPDAALLRDHFNDLLLIPAALPFLLLAQRRLGLRPDDAPPRAGEIVFHLLLWTALCEGLAPLLLPRAVGDPLDAVAYTLGAALAWLAWNRKPSPPGDDGISPPPRGG